MKKIIWILAVVVVLASFIGLILNKPKATDNSNSANTNDVDGEEVVENNYSDLITVDQPKSGQTVQSPLTITGQARGNWYFEASFPIKLVDQNGDMIAQGHAEAQSEWMTTDFVPFVATLDFDKVGDQNATLILSNDNPSGLPENDKQIKIPLYISQY